MSIRDETAACPDGSRGGEERSPARLGAIFFDMPDDPLRGWACVAGPNGRAGRATRFDDPGPMGLPSDVAWVTSWPDQALVETGLVGAGRFLGARYLREDARVLCAELGCRDPREACETTAALAGSALRVARALLGRPDFLPRWSLRRGLRLAVGEEDDLLVTPDLKAALDEACVRSVTCAAPRPAPGERVFRLRVPALRHCRDILAAELPAGPFTAVTDMPGAERGGETWRRWFDAVTDGGRLPGLFRITSRGLDRGRAALLNLGLRALDDGGQRAFAAPRAAGGAPRRWYTTAELDRLLDAGAVTVHESLVCRSTRRHRAAALLDRLPPWAALSAGAAAVAESLWSGMALPRVARPARAEGRVRCNADAPFLRSADLMLLHDRARALAARGLTVTGYACGAIRVRAADGEIPEIVAACLDLGLVPPALGTALRHWPGDPWHGRRTGEAFLELVGREPALALASLQGLRAMGHREDLLALDGALARRLEALTTDRGGDTRRVTGYGGLPS